MKKYKVGEKINGFTIIELLAVVVILGVVITFAAPNVLSLLSQSKTRMFCDKVVTINQSAKLYGDDKYALRTSKGETKKILENVSVLKLIDEGYVKKDNDKCEILFQSGVYKTKDANVPCLVDKRTDTSMDSAVIEIYTVYDRIYAKVKLSEADEKECAEYKNTDEE